MSIEQSSTRKVPRSSGTEFLNPTSNFLIAIFSGCTGLFKYIDYSGNNSFLYQFKVINVDLYYPTRFLETHDIYLFSTINVLDIFLFNIILLIHCHKQKKRLQKRLYEIYRVFFFHSWFLAKVNLFHSWFLATVNLFHSWFLATVYLFHSWFLATVNLFHSSFLATVYLFHSWFLATVNLFHSLQLV